MLEDRSAELYAAIDESGFYPGVATAEVRRLLGGAAVRAQLVITDVSVDEDGLQMEAQVLAVTDDRIVFWGAFEQAGQDGDPPVLHGHARVFPLRKVADVRLLTSVTNPAEFAADDVPDSVRVVFVMDQLDRFDLEPLGCQDEDCGGGHGFHGELVHDALLFYETKDAVGEVKLRELLRLGADVSALLGNHRA